MSVDRELNDELKRIIIDALNLDGVTPETIADDAPLFGEGLGLDSIDALEIAMAIEKRFRIKVQPDKETKRYFYSIQTLADLVRERQAG
ncbi:MAG TPA: phosphopantetheine-binding protein [Myxococcota bacterium]|jgi:acyl carrier protein|nr:phosphopantetheine-binding protein [Myxococcota bacterium]